jgi:hypothetical protein
MRTLGNCPVTRWAFWKRFWSSFQAVDRNARLTIEPCLHPVSVFSAFVISGIIGPVDDDTVKRVVTDPHRLIMPCWQAKDRVPSNPP